MRDRDLVRLYWPVEVRPAFDALFAIDDAMAEVVATSTQAALGAIRLAWWREALERLDSSPPPPEPRLQAVASELLPRGISGTGLAGISEGWAALLDEEPDVHQIARRGIALFAAGGRLLNANHPRLLEMGSLFAVGDASRKGFGPFEHWDWRSRFPRALRPLTGLAALAARDLRRELVEPEATPGRAITLLFHRLSGRVVYGPGASGTRISGTRDPSRSACRVGRAR